MNLIETSLLIATHAHLHQVDKANKPYILHPLRIMNKMDSELEMSAAILHDVIEDSHWKLEILIIRGIPKKVIDAIRCLTKKTNETYNDYISRISTNQIAIKVKIEDLKDNMNLNRLKSITNKDILRNKKYHNALLRLQEVK